MVSVFGFFMPEPSVEKLICNVSGCGPLYPAPISKEKLDSYDSLKYAHKSGGSLQSVGAAVVFRHFNLPGVDENQKTCTLNLVYRKGRKYFSAFVELPDTRQGMALVKRGVGENNRQNQLVLSGSDLFICDLLAQAKKERRIVPLPKEPVRLSTEPIRGKSAYGRSGLAIALFGHPETAERNAGILYKQGHFDSLIHQLSVDGAVDILCKSSDVVVFLLGLVGARMDVRMLTGLVFTFYMKVIVIL